MTYTQQSLYDYIVHNTLTTRNSVRTPLGEHLNPDIIVTFESKYSQRADTTFSHLVAAYGFSADTYRNYYNAYCELRNRGEITLEHLEVPPFCVNTALPNLELPSAPHEVIDLRIQVSNQQNRIHLLEQQLLQYNNISNKLELILKNQDTMHTIINQQALRSKTSANTPFTSSYDKNKESLQYIQKHFITLKNSCEDVVYAFIKLKDRKDSQCSEMDTLHKELLHLLNLFKAFKNNLFLDKIE